MSERKKYSISEFVEDFDFFEKETSTPVAELFIETIKDYVDDKIMLIFPAFYDFEFSENKKGNEIIIYSDLPETDHYIGYKANYANAIKTHLSAINDHKTLSLLYCKEIGEEASYLKVNKRTYWEGEEKKYNLVYDTFTNKDKIDNNKSGTIEINRNDYINTKDYKNGESKFIGETLSQSHNLKIERNINYQYFPEITTLQIAIYNHLALFGDEKITIYYFFTNNLKLKEGTKKGFGGLFVIAKEELGKKELDFFKQINYNLSNKIAINLANRKIKQANIKSAISAIMSRNMSHNLGSHVVATTSHSYNNPVDMQYLFTYLQHRMDFIAQITSTWPRWTASLPLVKFIMRSFYEQRLLLNYIVRSEGLSAYEFGNKEEPNNRILKIEIGYLEDKSGENIEIENFSNDDVTWIFDPEKHEQDKFHDVNVAIPGGVVGTHAFYGILENFIRNTAKHEWAKLDESLKENSNLSIKIVFFDDKKNDIVKLFLYHEIEFNRRDKLEIINIGKEELDKTVSNINNHFKTPLFNRALGGSRTSELGIAEMKICSNFLNLSYPTEVDKDTDYPKAYMINNNTWGYKFILSKPKLALIIGLSQTNTSSWKDKSKSERNKNIIFEKEGVKICKSLKKDQSFDYEIVLFSETEFEKFIGNLSNKDRLSMLPIRTIVFVRSDDASEKYKNFTNKVMLYKHDDNDEYVKLFSKEENAEIIVFKCRELYSKLLAEDKTIELTIKPIENGTKGGAVANDNFESFFKSFLENEFSKCLNFSNLDKGKVEIKEINEINNLLKTIKRTESNPTFNLKKIETASVIYLKKSLKKLYTKYAEDIQTLPPLFRQDNNKQSNNKFTKTYFISKIKKEPYKIEYVRHNKSVVKDCYRESLSGAQSYFIELYEFVNSNSHELSTLPFELIENGLRKYYIVDERICEFYHNQSYDVKIRFKNIGVEIAPLPSNNKASGYFESIDSCENKSEKTLIVHLGILDKIELDKKTYEILDSFQYVFITSGRAPNLDNFLKRGYRYIPISEITNTLQTQFPEKLLLTRTLSKTINDKT